MIVQYAKAIAFIVAAALAALIAPITDGVLTPLELVTVCIAVVTAVGVYLVPNLPTGVGSYLKGIVAFIGAGLSALAVVLGTVNGWSGVSLSDWLTVIMACLGGIGVVIVPNEAPHVPGAHELTSGTVLAANAAGGSPSL